MRPKKGPLDLGLQVQHCPEVFVAGDEFERYGECMSLNGPSRHSFGREGTDRSSVRYEAFQLTFFPFLL